MSSGSSTWVTVLLRLPLFYNPDAAGHRAPVEDEKFLDTADEIARRFYLKFVGPVEHLIVGEEEVGDED